MHQVDMHQIDLHVDILYIPNAFLTHRSDTGTTNGSNTDPNPWILCHGRECRFRVPTLWYRFLLRTGTKGLQPCGSRPAHVEAPVVPVPEETGTKG